MPEHEFAEHEFAEQEFAVRIEHLLASSRHRYEGRPSDGPRNAVAGEQERCEPAAASSATGSSGTAPTGRRR
ncbi:hypothetical protein [Herbiconiux sp.]|uniref:hypothetical protein n=1 Tax=Herbiconiux sp. TaxID=1871186 RepID=UPI0025C0D6C6|nr:hypothetical protein [Herbiconiux sp.]